jgi:hypothetical protein
MRPQQRAPDYRVVAAWSGFLLVLGAGAFALGMAFHNEAIAQHQPPHPEQIYYCATGTDGHRDAGLRAVPRPEGSEGYLMSEQVGAYSSFCEGKRRVLMDAPQVPLMGSFRREAV